jgi:hypothetical protein
MDSPSPIPSPGHRLPRFATTVKQERSAENRLRLVLVFLTVLWLGITVVLPVYELLDRSLHVDVPVIIFGEDDIRVGGRKISLKDEALLIDGEAAELTGGKGGRAGVEVKVGGGQDSGRFLRGDPPSAGNATDFSDSHRPEGRRL